MNLEKPTRFILKAIPLSDVSSDISPKVQEQVDLTHSGQIRDKNLNFDSCSQNSLSSQGISGLQVLLETQGNAAQHNSNRNLSKFAKLEQNNNAQVDETYSERSGVIMESAQRK